MITIENLLQNKAIIEAGTGVKEVELYIKRLKEFLPESLSQIFYVNSGSEAIEGALKAARFIITQPKGLYDMKNLVK